MQGHVEIQRYRTFYHSWTALYFYDYLLTLPSELSTIWSRKFTGATVLFIINRYSFAIAYALTLYSPPGNISDAKCVGAHATHLPHLF